jgi:hypothetical protein
MIREVRTFATMWTALRRGRSPAAVEIADHPGQACSEGVIERISHRRGAVEVTLVLADGTGASARMDRHRADWLELRTGDIVPVRAAAAARAVSA